MIKGSTYYNYEGYYDPTAGQAINKADKEQEAKPTVKLKRKKRKRSAAKASKS